MRSNEGDTWYDAGGSIEFTVSKGLPGVGLPGIAVKGSTDYGIESPDCLESNIPVGWEDIRSLKEGTVTCKIAGDPMPEGPLQQTATYRVPFDGCDREEDYGAAWDAFSSGFGITS